MPSYAVFKGVRPLFTKMVCVPVLMLLVAGTAVADEIGEALDASLAAQRAARESQQRVDTLAAETRALHDKRRAAEWRALQLAAYADQLEQEAQVQEQRRDGIRAELARVSATGTDLLPLAQRMLAELEAHLARDLPFLASVRRQRVDEARRLLADPQRGQAEKFRRVLEAWRSEFEFGYTIGAEDLATDCAGAPAQAPNQAVGVRIGRVGFYCLASDGKSAARWDAAAKRWSPLEDDDEIEQVALAAAMAREKAPAGVLVLPVEKGRK
jgi:hypothetical protein